MVCMKLHNLCIDRNVAVPNRRFLMMSEKVMNGQCMITPMKMTYFFVVELPVTADMILQQSLKL
jgi:hypothetical protein